MPGLLGGCRATGNVALGGGLPAWAGGGGPRARDGESEMGGGAGEVQVDDRGLRRGRGLSGPTIPRSMSQLVAQGAGQAD